MRYAVDVPTAGEYADPRRLSELAREAEQAGWDGFFIWDVIFQWGRTDVPVVDPWIALAAIAMRTERIKIGALMTPLPRRRPWQIARQAATLDHLSHGRLIFGAGLGYQALDFAPFGEPFDANLRAERLDEGLDIVSGLWTGQPFEYHGEHYQIDRVTFALTPFQSPRIPIWIAGGWPRRRPFQRAARWDGVYLMTVNQVTNELLTPQEIEEIVSFIGRYRLDSAPFDVAVNGLAPLEAGELAALIRPYAEAGVTWWVEYDGYDSFDAYRERIRMGPPRF